jgi:nicotinamidase/pyrazinamidase
MSDRPEPVPVGIHDALLVVDVQRDFLPGGALAVPGGDAIVPVLNRCLREFARAGAPVFCSRDWHPANHCSFRAQGGPWPAHCVAGTAGADFAPGLQLPPDAAIVSKATRAERDAYSAFDGTGLAARLHAARVRRVFIGGLATDYCVRATALDARDSGFDVVLLTDAVRAVDMTPGDGARAMEEMQARGIALAESAEAVAHQDAD